MMGETQVEETQMIETEAEETGAEQTAKFFLSIFKAFVVFFVGVAVFIVIQLSITYSGIGIRKNEPYEYINGNYLSYEGSDSVIGFFPQYIDLSDASDIDFHYVDTRKKTTLFHRFCISYALDVRYDNKEVYELIKSEIIEYLYNERYEYDYGSFVLYEVEERKENIAQCIGFHDERCIIRYIAFYGSVGNQSTYSLINWNTELEWYRQDIWDRRV